VIDRRLVLAACLTLVVCGPRTSAESVKDIEDDIVRLTREVEQARQDVEPLAAPWLRTRDLTLEISGDLLTSVIEDLDALKIARVNLAVTDHRGQLWGWQADCRVWDPFCNIPHGCWRTYAREGAYIEFNDPNYRFRAEAELEDLRGTWVSQRGVRVDLHASLRAEVGSLKGNRYSCVGASIGGRGGPASGEADGDVGALADLLGLDATGVRYRLNVGVERIRYGIRVDMGSLPDLLVDGTFPGMKVDLGGHFGVPLSLDGELDLPPPAPDLIYHLRLTNTAVFATDRAVRAETDLIVQWK
jgi:hypothetical protein